MAPIKLQDYSEVLDELLSEFSFDDERRVQIALESSFAQAALLMSPAGLQKYLDGARTLNNLGRGPDLVVSYLEEMPLVVKECGEDIIGDCVTAATKVSSMTSGSVIALFLTSLSTAAAHLGDANLVRGYLTLMHQLAVTSPRGLRPMLGHLDELLSKLTLSGLRRWANFGAQAYRSDFGNLTDYFSLDSADSRAMLESERRGVLFVGAQRRLSFYLRALWGQDFLLRPIEADSAEFRPYIENRTLYLPDALDDHREIPGIELYRATVAHMAAHLMYSQQLLSTEQLSPAQMFFVGMLEDARVEYLAIEEFPGLANLWSSLIKMDEETVPEHKTMPILEGLARRLLDPVTVSGAPDLDGLDRFVAKFHSQIAENSENSQFSRRMGIELFSIIAGHKAVPSLRILERHRITYRDDNRILWNFEDPALSGFDGLEHEAANHCQVSYEVSPLLMATTLDTELAGDDAQEIWTCSDVMRVYEDDLSDYALTFNELFGSTPISDPFYYPEWDYRIQLNRPDWVSVYERRLGGGNPEDIDQILVRHKTIVKRIRQIIDLLAPAGVQRQRGVEDGDEIDLNAAVDAMVALRMGQRPSQRITMRNVLKTRDLAVIVLLDLSESTNEQAGNTDRTILQLTREAAALVSTAIEGVRDPFAVHGFASDGRHDVQYFPLKDFEQRFDVEAKARLAGMQGGLSTRMGAAIRHAGYYLSQRPERKKLILLVTDGEPADVDENDPQHLVQDAKKAVEGLHREGVQTYCLTLDPHADTYVKRIFGEGGYIIIDRVERLPEKLPLLFARLTG